MSLHSHNLSEQNKSRVNSILDVIMAYARLDFSQKTNVIGNNDILDAISAGVNMLGEELEMSTISLREKEQLLKEVHHRVKNNLQIVSSLLSLQTEGVADQQYLELIADSRSRIQTMALIHEMLYSSRDYGKIETADYIRHLCGSINLSFSRPGSDISFNFDLVENVKLDIDRMIPGGLILNEILSNIYKYAFPQNKGRVDVSLRRNGDSHVLRVGDNGVGISDNVLTTDSAHLGVQLIHMLSEQIGGKVVMTQSNGTSYELTF